MLGLVYWHRGLVGSVAAHACFNGMLLVAALAASHGPPVSLAAAGASITVPAAWHAVGPAPGGVLAAVGPSGARIDLGRVDVGQPLDATVLAEDLAQGRMAPLPGATVQGSVAVLDLPAGRAVMLAATVRGHEARLVMLPRGALVWIAAVETAGSHRAAVDFQRSLSTLGLP
ncbi:MAG: hypothetical protein ABR511_13745 [Acidimicrobiales bacterium]